MYFWAQMPKYGNLGLDPLRMMIFHQVMNFFSNISNSGHTVGRGVYSSMAVYLSLYSIGFHVQ